MTDDSSRILNILTDAQARGYVPLRMRSLEVLFGVKERGLQSNKDSPGILETARKEIFQETGWVIVTLTGPKGGVLITKDEEVIKHARNQLADHLWSEKRNVDTYDAILSEIEAYKRNVKQIPIFQEAVGK